MTKDINDLITIVRQKNGRVRIKHNITNEGNIYKLLRDFGYRKSKLGKKRIYFRRQGDNIVPVNPWQLKDAFREFLNSGDLSNIPNDVTQSDIIEWYHRTHPIKENGLFDHYLGDTLTQAEAHDFLLATDLEYKHRFNTQQLLSKFDEWGFSKTVDTINSYCKGNPPLYYKRIDDNKFLVFNHYNAKSNERDGFDSWVATYSNEKHIGTKRPQDLQDIRLSFQLDTDFQLIKQYVS